MAKARVELKGASTFSSRGRKFKKGFPQVLTNPSDIQYYKGQPDFDVQILDEMIVEKKPAITKVRKIEKSDPGVEKVALKSLPKKAAPPVEKEFHFHKYGKLKTMKKVQLVAIAEEIEVFLEGNESKSKMINSILEAQEKMQKAAKEKENEQ